MDTASEALLLGAAALGTLSVCGLFACSQAAAELAVGPASLFRSVRAQLAPPAARAGPTAGRAPGSAALAAAALSLAVNANTNLSLAPLRALVPLPSSGLLGGALFVLAVCLLPASEWLGERGVLAGRGRRPGLVGAVALAVSLLCTGAAHAFFDVRSVVGPLPPKPPPPTLRAHRTLVGLTPERLRGIYVGTLDADVLVLTVVPRAGEGRVECALNARTRELVTFEAAVHERNGLVAKSLPGLDVGFGTAFGDADGRIWIPLVDAGGRVRGVLSETDGLRR